MKETLREVISRQRRGRRGQILAGTFTAPHLDALLPPTPWVGSRPPTSANPFPYPAGPPPSQAPPHSATTAPNGLILCRADTPRPPPPPHQWKDQLLEEEVWAVSIYKTLCPGPGPPQSSFGGHSRCKGCSPRFSPCPLPPLQTPPNQWHQPKTQFLQFPPTAHY